jgi:hypothetical protein
MNVSRNEFTKGISLIQNPSGVNLSIDRQKILSFVYDEIQKKSQQQMFQRQLNNSPPPSLGYNQQQQQQKQQQSSSTIDYEMQEEERRILSDLESLLYITSPYYY